MYKLFFTDDESQNAHLKLVYELGYYKGRCFTLENENNNLRNKNTVLTQRCLQLATQDLTNNINGGNNGK